MSLKKQTLWSLAPLLVVTVVNLFSVPMFYHSLGAEMYALWFYVLTFSGSFGFMDLGLGVAVGRYMGVAMGRGDQVAVRSYWATGNAIAIPLLGCMALVFTTIGVVFGPKWFNIAPQQASLLRSSFIAGGVGLFFSYYGQFWNNLSQAHLDFKFLSIVRIAISFLQIFPSILIAYFTGNPFLIILWTTITSGLQLLVYILHARKNYSLGFHLREASWADMHEMASYTGKTFVTLLINSLLGSVDRLILGKLAPATAFAQYNIATNVGGRIFGLSNAVMGPVFHNTSRTMGDSSQVTPAEIYNETFRSMFGWYLLAGVWATVWAKPALQLWLGTQLGSEMKPILAPILIGFCISAISNISGSQLGPLNRVEIGIYFHIAAGLLLLGGVWIGWYFAGIKGVAYGFLASRFALVAQDIFVIRLVHGEGWFARETWEQIAIQSLIGLGFYLVVSLVGDARYVWIPLALLHAGVIIFWLLKESIRLKPARA